MWPSRPAEPNLKTAGTEPRVQAAIGDRTAGAGLGLACCEPASLGQVTGPCSPH